MKTKDPPEIRVRNIMLDGEIRDSMEGVTVPASCEVYAVLARLMKGERNDKRAAQCSAS